MFKKINIVSVHRIIMMEDNIHILIATMSQKDQMIEKLIQEDHNTHPQCQCINSHINANVSRNVLPLPLSDSCLSYQSVEDHLQDSERDKLSLYLTIHVINYK